MNQTIDWIRFGIKVTVDLKSNFCVWLLGLISCHGNMMKVSISAILRHRQLKFGIQIPLDLRTEFCLVAKWIWLPWQNKGFILSATVKH